MNSNELLTYIQDGKGDSISVLLTMAGLDVYETRTFEDLSDTDTLKYMFENYGPALIR
jgi:hypothetical protein